MTPRAPLLACACLLLPGCVAALAGAGAAYIVKEEYLPSGYQETRVMRDVDLLWSAAKEGMMILSTEPMVVQDFPREIRGVVRGHDVTVVVQAYDMGETILRVRAKRPVGYDEDTAVYVTEYILGRARENAPR